MWYLTMRLTFGSIFELTIRYAYLRGNTYYYQRKIPVDLLERYGGVQLIKVNLKTTNLKKIAKQISALNKQHESIWSLLRLDPTLKPFPVHKEAIKLLANHGLKPKPATNEEPNIDQFIDLLQVKQEAYAQGDEEIYLNAESEGYLDPVEIEAVRLINEAPKFRLSDALEIYLNGHLKKNDEKFCTYTRRVWNKLLEIVGDKEFEQVSRADANTFITKRLDENSKTTTIDRQISVINAVFNVVITENELTKANPFHKSRIPGLGNDTKARGIFDISQLSTLVHECKNKDDDIRWLLALQIGLGCRHAEVTELALENLHLNTDLPYVSFEPHPWRSLKTKPSKRNVPLVGVSLWAANKIVELAKQGQDYTFARYTNKSRCNADYSSATLNKWIRSLGIDKTTHELRHTMRDKLRLANAPKSIQDAVGGWSKEDRGDNYGLGYSLEQLKGWLDKVVLK